MKKLIFTGIFLLSLFGGIIGVSADTLYRTSSENGKVKLTIDTEEGFVGALDLTVAVAGNVSVKGITFDSSLSKEYVKKYTYDKNTGIVKIYLATGSTTKNLANSKGKIAVGELLVASTSSKEETFTVQIEGLTTTNANYKSSVRSVKNDDTNAFVYTSNKEGNPSNEGTATNDSKTNESQKTTTNNTSKNEAKSDKKDTNKESATDEEETVTKDSNKKENNKKTDTPKQVKAKEKQEQKNIAYILLLGLSLVIVVVSAVYVRKNNK